MAHLTMKTISRLSGVSAHTLRAWERRYGAVRPERSSGGQRSYSLKELERLRKLKTLTDQGFSIGQIAKLSERELATLLGESKKGHNPSHQPKFDDPYLEKLLNDLTQFNLLGISDSLRQLRQVHKPRELIFGILVPLLQEVGELVNSGDLSISQEHALSSLIRDQLAQIVLDLQLRNFNSKNIIALATPEGDHHEFGILFGQVLALLHGYQAHFLGANLPNHSLIEALEALKPQRIVLGSTKIPEEHRPEVLDSYLGPILEHGVSVWLGGSGAGAVTNESILSKIRVIRSLEELDQLLEREVR